MIGFSARLIGGGFADAVLSRTLGRSSLARLKGLRTGSSSASSFGPRNGDLRGSGVTFVGRGGILNGPVDSRTDLVALWGLVTVIEFVADATALCSSRGLCADVDEVGASTVTAGMVKYGERGPIEIGRCLGVPGAPGRSREP